MSYLNDLACRRLEIKSIELMDATRSRDIYQEFLKLLPRNLPKWKGESRRCMRVTAKKYCSLASRQNNLVTAVKAIELKLMHSHNNDGRHVGRISQRIQDCIKNQVSTWLRQQLTRPRRSQSDCSRK